MFDDKIPTLRELLKSGASGIALGAISLAAPATAQDSSSEAQPEIVVTGSRIPQPNLEAAAPVTVVSSQDLKLQGTAKVEDLLNSLPQVFASQASTISNASDGTASVDLRGLGTSRTLSLVNGRRLLPGDPTPTSGSAADINMIPAAMVKRIDVFTGGASTTYGADAVAGVVNFVMDTDFTGLRLDAQYSLYQHNNRNELLPPLLERRKAQGLQGYTYPTGNVVDGGTIDATLAFGMQFDDGRGKAVVYAGFREARPITQNRRDYSSCTVQNTFGGVPECGGSATSGNGNVLLIDGGTTTFYTFAPNGGFQNAVSRYNFAPTNYYQRPDKRYTAGLFAEYEVNDSVEPYLEFMFMDDRTVAQIAPSGNFGNTLLINSDNPLISPTQRAVIFDNENLINGYLGPQPTPIGASYNPNPAAPPLTFFDAATGTPYNQAAFQLLRRNVEGGPRQDDLQHTNFRTVVGLRGDLGAGFSYDAFYQYGRSNFSRVYRGEFSAVRLARALDVVDGDPGPGVNPVCRSFRDGTDRSCVPYNVFGGEGAASAASVAYLSVDGFQNGQTQEQVANVSVTGQLGDLGVQSPWSSDGVGINAGFEWRDESLELRTDNAFATGDLTGQGGATLPIAGGFRVHEFFAETRIPLVTDSFFDNLSVAAAYRKSYYRTSGGNEFDTDTYKFEAEFAPIRDVRLRATYNRAARAPNIQELFATPTVGLAGGQDPCAGVTITTTDYGCRAQGLAIGQTVVGNPAGQYNGLLGGNPDLQPEKATTKTVGVVLQPSFLPRFSLSVDYFDISIRDAIQPAAQDSILKDCVANATATVTPVSCGLVNRDVTGSLWLTPGGYVDNTPSNLGKLRTSGIEVNGAFSQPIGGAGTLSLSFAGTYLDRYEVDNGITEPYDCAGLFGLVCSAGGTTSSGAPLPKWRHKARATFQTADGMGLSLQWRHIASVRAETLSDSLSLSAPPEERFDPGLSLRAMDYFDVAATFAVGSNFNFRLGVNNLLDTEPPLFTSGNAGRPGSNLCQAGPCNGNTFPAVYDALGRYFYAGVTMNF